MNIASSTPNFHAGPEQRTDAVDIAIGGAELRQEVGLPTGDYV